MKKEPIRHHYIPQFILRNFCVDEMGNTFFIEKNSKNITKRQVRDLFMGRNLYRDTINNDNPIKIEEDLALFENDVARIIKDKFLSKDEFVLTQYEDDKLKLFFALMSFRAKSTQEFFKKQLSKESKKIYSIWQRNKDFEDFWKRNLGSLARCRSLKEVLDSAEIDEPIKGFFKRDTFGIFGKYFCVVEPKDIGEFVLSDCYPVVLTGVCESPFYKSFEVGIYDIYALSPKRAILFANLGCQVCEQDILKMRQLVLNEPVKNDKSEFVIRVKKLYLEEVDEINNMIIKHAEEGYITKGEKRIDFK